MRKALLPLIIASVLPTAAFADVVVYGKANVSFQNTDKTASATKVGDVTYTEVVSNASRIGLKGSEAINDDLKAIYQFEYEARPDDGTGPFSQRNIYVGLQGTAGTGMIGMFDTPLKTSQEKVDLFNDLIGDLKTVLKGEIRAKNVVQYATPAFSNVVGTVAYVNTEADVQGVANGYSASVVYNTKAVYLAIANDHNVQNALDQKVVPGDTHDTIRAVGRFVVGPVQLGAMYETYSDGKVDEDGFLASAQWNINADWAAKVQYVQSDMIYDGNTSISLGADYKLSKATKLFGYATKIEDDRAAVIPATLDKTAADDTYVGVGIEMNF